MFDSVLSNYEEVFALVVFCVSLAVMLGVKAIFLRQLSRLVATRPFHFLNYLEQLLRATRFVSLLTIAFLIAVSQLDLSTRHEKWLHYAWVIVLVFQVALWANRLVLVSVNRSLARQREIDPSGTTHLMMLGLIARITLWTVAILAALDNLGFNITTLMASLGIGGIAVALAAQNILGDLFASVSIALDKPFVIGDFIIVDEYLGTVQYVGLKTTRLLSLGGEQIIFSNTELLKNRIRNYRQMQERRVAFQFGVAYHTHPDLLEEIPNIIKEILHAQKIPVRFDRAHFKSLDVNALQFEVVYFVLDPDYNKYMDVQQNINLTLMRKLMERGIGFAHPLRMVYTRQTEDGTPTSTLVAGDREAENRPG